MKVELYEHQQKAIQEMHNGCILVGGVGTGKSRTSLAYFLHRVCLGSEDTGYVASPCDLYIITTAKKRDSNDWQREAALFMLNGKRDASLGGIRVTVDSWNNIGKYTDVYGAFFIFDEQRLVGSGAWVKSFYKIVKRNKWILLSATPADTWSDYIPVMVANGFYRNKTEFLRMHAVFNRFTNYPKIDKYINTGLLIKNRDKILVTMPYRKHTKRYTIKVSVSYDKKRYDKVAKERWDIFKNEPVHDAGGLCYTLRHVVNESPDRLRALKEIYNDARCVIVFYNFDYELAILEQFAKTNQILYSAYNGHTHDEIPVGKSWLYFVQYTAGAEAWECIRTNVIVFYSLNYSYRVTTQSQGRIDRLNTPFDDLFYYFLVSDSSIDKSIMRSLTNKKRFNAKAFVEKM